MSGLGLGIAAAGVTGVGISAWLRFISDVSLEEKRWIVNSLIAAALALGVAAFTQGPGLLGGVLAGVAIAFAGIYFVLLSLAGQSKQAATVAVGAALPDFTAPDHNGDPFTLSSLDGKPILMKFFRGHW